MSPEEAITAVGASALIQRRIDPTLLEYQQRYTPFLTAFANYVDENIKWNRGAIEYRRPEMEQTMSNIKETALDFAIRAGGSVSLARDFETYLTSDDLLDEAFEHGFAHGFDEGQEVGWEEGFDAALADDQDRAQPDWNIPDLPFEASTGYADMVNNVKPEKTIQDTLAGFYDLLQQAWRALEVTGQ